MSADPPTDSFAAMFEQSAAPSRRRFKVGERVEGRIVQVGRDSVFVELEGGVQGYFDAAELRAADGTLPVTVGETIAARVTEVDAGRGHVRLARQASIARSFKPSSGSRGTGGGKGGRDTGDGGAAFEQAKDAQIAVEGKVTGVNKGGLEVDVAGNRAFCPLSQAADRFLEDPKELIGQTFHFLVTEVRDGGKNVVLSRRAFLKREAAEGRLGDGGEGEGKVAADPSAPAKAKGNAAPKGPEVVIALGSVVKGTVDRIESYGVFLQIEGTRGREGRGLVPAAELGVPRGTDLRKKFPQGTVLTAKVLDVGEGKLRLSVRGALAAEEQAEFENAKVALAKSGAGGTSLGTFADLLTRKQLIESLGQARAPADRPRRARPDRGTPRAPRSTQPSDSRCGFITCTSNTWNPALVQSRCARCAKATFEASVRAVEHRLAGEERAHGDAVDPADQRPRPRTPRRCAPTRARASARSR